MSKEQERIQGLDFLRGLASLAVCWFHLTSFTYSTPDGWFYTPLRLSGAYGWLGVEIFFVISGFVIPYSLHRAGYEIKSYPTFLLKRITRLDPPYIVSIVIVLALTFAYALYKGAPPEIEGKPIDATRVLLHLGYVNVFFGYEWLNPSFWTLAIEFQYYILMGLVFPFVNSRRRVLRLTAFAIFGMSCLLSGASLLPGGAPYSNFIFRFIFIFLLGVATFQRRAGIIGRAEYALLLSLGAAGCLATVGLPSTAAALTSVVVIWFYKSRNFISDFFGNISYSLYLLHWPLGHLTLSLLGLKLLKGEGDAARTLVILVAFVVCVAASYLLYIGVERPSQRWASRFRYKRAAKVSPSGFVGAEQASTSILS